MKRSSNARGRKGAGYAAPFAHGGAGGGDPSSYTSASSSGHRSRHPPPHHSRSGAASHPHHPHHPHHSSSSSSASFSSSSSSSSSAHNQRHRSRASGSASPSPSSSSSSAPASAVHARSHALSTPRRAPRHTEPLRANTSLGPPDVFEPRASCTEESLSMMHMSVGYQQPRILRDPYCSLIGYFARGDVDIEALKQKIQKNLNDIGWMKSQGSQQTTSARSEFLKRYRQNEPFPHFHGTAQPGEARLQEWAERLAGDERLRALAKEVPRLRKFDHALKLVEKANVPLLRALWYVKVIALNSKGLARSHQRHKLKVQSEPTRDWCQCVVLRIAEHLKGRHGSGGGDVEDFGDALLYLARCMAWSICEGLVDEQVWLRLLFEVRPSEEMAELFFSLLIPHLKAIMDADAQCKALVELCRSRLKRRDRARSSLEPSPRSGSNGPQGTGADPSLVTVAHIVCALLVALPDQLASFDTPLLVECAHRASAGEASEAGDEEWSAPEVFFRTCAAGRSLFLECIERIEQTRHLMGRFTRPSYSTPVLLLLDKLGTAQEQEFLCATMGYSCPDMFSVLMENIKKRFRMAAYGLNAELVRDLISWGISSGELDQSYDRLLAAGTILRLYHNLLCQNSADGGNASSSSSPSPFSAAASSASSASPASSPSSSSSSSHMPLQPFLLDVVTGVCIGAECFHRAVLLLSLLHQHNLFSHTHLAKHLIRTNAACRRETWELLRHLPMDQSASPSDHNQRRSILFRIARSAHRRDEQLVEELRALAGALVSNVASTDDVLVPSLLLRFAGPAMENIAALLAEARDYDSGGGAERGRRKSREAGNGESDKGESKAESKGDKESKRGDRGDGKGQDGGGVHSQHKQRQKQEQHTPLNAFSVWSRVPQYYLNIVFDDAFFANMKESVRTGTILPLQLQAVISLVFAAHRHTAATAFLVWLCEAHIPPHFAPAALDALLTRSPTLLALSALAPAEPRRDFVARIFERAGADTSSPSPSIWSTALVRLVSRHHLPSRRCKNMVNAYLHSLPNKVTKTKIMADCDVLEKTFASVKPRPLPSLPDPDSAAAPSLQQVAAELMEKKLSGHPPSALEWNSMASEQVRSLFASEEFSPAVACVWSREMMQAGDDWSTMCMVLVQALAHLRDTKLEALAHIFQVIAMAAVNVLAEEGTAGKQERLLAFLVVSMGELLVFFDDIPLFFADVLRSTTTSPKVKETAISLLKGLLLGSHPLHHAISCAVLQSLEDRRRRVRPSVLVTALLALIEYDKKQEADTIAECVISGTGEHACIISDEVCASILLGASDETRERLNSAALAPAERRVLFACAMNTVSISVGRDPMPVRFSACQESDRDNISAAFRVLLPHIRAWGIRPCLVFARLLNDECKHANGAKGAVGALQRHPPSSSPYGLGSSPALSASASSAEHVVPRLLLDEMFAILPLHSSLAHHFNALLRHWMTHHGVKEHLFKRISSVLSAPEVLSGNMLMCEYMAQMQVKDDDTMDTETQSRARDRRLCARRDIKLQEDLIALLIPLLSTNDVRLREAFFFGILDQLEKIIALCCVTTPAAAPPHPHMHASTTAPAGASDGRAHSFMRAQQNVLLRLRLLAAAHNKEKPRDYLAKIGPVLLRLLRADCMQTSETGDDLTSCILYTIDLLFDDKSSRDDKKSSRDDLKRLMCDELQRQSFPSELHWRIVRCSWLFEQLAHPQNMRLVQTSAITPAQVADALYRTQNADNASSTGAPPQSTGAFSGPGSAYFHGMGLTPSPSPVRSTPIARTPSPGGASATTPGGGFASTTSSGAGTAGASGANNTTAAFTARKASVEEVDPWHMLEDFPPAPPDARMFAGVRRERRQLKYASAILAGSSKH